MILRNSLGREKEFEILIEVEKKNKDYIVYKDFNTGSFHAGIKKKNKLVPVNDEERNYLDELLRKVWE